MSSVRQRRLESKKRKAIAFLEIAKLNDMDKQKAKDDEEEAEGSKAKKPKSGESGNNGRLSDKPLLSGDDYAALRAQLKERSKALKQLPKFELKSQGHDASVENLPNQRIPLFLSDLQHVLAYTMVGDRTPYQPFSWCTMLKWNKLPQVICLIVEDLSASDFLQYRENDKNVAEIGNIFPDNKLEFLSAASYDSTTAKELSVLPVTHTKRKMLKEKYGNLEEVLEKGEAFHVYRSMFPIKKQKSVKKGDGEEECLKLRLLLSARQMVEENYPLPLSGSMDQKYKDYVMTKDSYEEVHPDSPLFSVDCEMCITVTGKYELTRICVVDADLKVVYHSLVKPDNAIKKYLTQFSGITEELLEGVTTRLEDVQKALRELLPPDCILVGQSLNSDLNALRMMHPYVIDTSVIYCITGSRRRKTKLSVLSSLFLGQSIQNNEDGKKGHNPIEDAQAAMKLVNLKLEKGYEYGDVLLNGSIPSLEKKEEEETKVLGMSFLDLIKKNEKKIKIVCQSDLRDHYKDIPKSEEYMSTAEESEEAKDCVTTACNSAFDNNMTICHIRVSKEKEDPSKVFKRVRRFTEKLWSHTSENGMFFTVWTGRKAENAFVGIAMKKSEKK